MEGEGTSVCGREVNLVRQLVVDEYVANEVNQSGEEDVVAT